MDRLESRYGALHGLSSEFSEDPVIPAKAVTQNDAEVTPITREKAIKGWKRAWKLRMIEKDNSRWRELIREFV